MNCILTKNNLSYYKEYVYNICIMQRMIKKKKVHIPIIEDGMYVVGILGPIMTIPQAVQVWTTPHVQGLSLLTWSMYSVIAAAWCGYGYFHKEKPLYITNGLVALLDIIIVCGIIMKA